MDVASRSHEKEVSFSVESFPYRHCDRAFPQPRPAWRDTPHPRSTGRSQAPAFCASNRDERSPPSDSQAAPLHWLLDHHQLTPADGAAVRTFGQTVTQVPASCRRPGRRVRFGGRPPARQAAISMPLAKPAQAANSAGRGAVAQLTRGEARSFTWLRHRQPRSSTGTVTTLSTSSISRESVGAATCARWMERNGDLSAPIPPPARVDQRSRWTPRYQHTGEESADAVTREGCPAAADIQRQTSAARHPRRCRRAKSLSTCPGSRRPVAGDCATVAAASLSAPYWAAPASMPGPSPLVMATARLRNQTVPSPWGLAAPTMVRPFKSQAPSGDTLTGQSAASASSAGWHPGPASGLAGACADQPMAQEPPLPAPRAAPL